jgi:muramoyltetrapeptide carboxypeptidase LdcA involved in peptidoglycan recycling
MRTTLTLEDDVVALLRQARAKTNKSFKQLINETLRQALIAEASRASEERATYRTRSHDSGRCLVGNLESVADALAMAEGDDFK